MTAANFRWFLILLMALMVSGCGSNKTKDTSSGGAAVEDRGISSDEMNEIDAGARTQGLDDGNQYSRSALGDPNDPNGPLSVRVIYFDYDSSNVRADFRVTIEAHAAYLAANPSTVVTLEGHADERGSREYNLALGERRALAVRKQLVLLGASAGQVRTVSYGEERPVTEGHSEESYALNRRVEILY